MGFYGFNEISWDFMGLNEILLGISGAKLDLNGI